jgi:hypothetical protein
MSKKYYSQKKIIPSKILSEDFFIAWLITVDDFAEKEYFTEQCGYYCDECEAKSFYSPDNIQREIYKELGDVQFDAFQQSSSNMLISNERMSLSPLFGQKVVVLKV